MKTKLIFGTCIVLGLALVADQALAGVIVAPTSAVVDAGGTSLASISVTHDQSGLSAGYTSGVTDFDTYIGTGPIHTQFFVGFEWFSDFGSFGAVVTYDLGSVMSIDRLALWNEEFSGIGLLDLLSSTGGVIFSEFATDLAPFNNPLGSDYPVEVFSFAPVAMRYIRFNITDSPQPDGGGHSGAGIGEVAFRVADQNAVVPEPTSLALWGLGMVGMAIAARRRQKGTA